MDAKQTGQLIARRRKELGLSQADLAERLHVTDKAISKWETGRGMPAIDTLEPLAAALDLSVSEILSGRELTPEELPAAADAQILETMRENRRAVWRGMAVILACLALLAGVVLGHHWFTSAEETDIAGLERLAAEYLKNDSLVIVETERRGNYLAALCTDDAGGWAMCVYDRDSVFEDRWEASGGKRRMTGGGLSSWNYGSPQREAVIIFCGGELPTEAAYYTFQNSGMTYTCPIENRQVLDIFLLPDTADISSYPKELLDADMQPLEWTRPTDAVSAG